MKKNKLLSKQKIIIFSGLFLVVVALICLISVEKIAKKKESFILEVKQVYEIATKKYESNKNLLYSSNGINSLSLNNKDIKYCINYNNDGVESLEITNGAYYTLIKDLKDLKTKNVSRKKSGNFKCSNGLPVLAKSGYNGSIKARQSVFGINEIEYAKIEKIEFVNNIDVPKNAIKSFDMSSKKNKSVIGWYLDKDKNGLFELYIGGKGGVATSEDISYLFAGYNNLKTINMSNLDTSNATDMKGMFYYLVELESVNFGDFETSYVTDMSSMFYYTVKLKSLDVSKFNTSNVVDMSNMFTGNWALTKLDLSGFDTRKVETMNSMFLDCSKLNELNIKNFNVSSVRDLSLMFSKCYLLTNIIVDDFNVNSRSEIKGMLCEAQNIAKDNKMLNKLSDEQKEQAYLCK